VSTATHPDDEGRCPACGDLAPTSPLPAGDWTYLVCSRCASAWLDPLPAADPLDLYGQGYFRSDADEVTPGGYDDYAADEDLHRANAQERLARIQEALGRGGAGNHLLDVGCAHGFLLDEAKAADWHTTGVEVSPGARAAAEAKGHQVAPSLAEVAGGPFDAVGFFQVLEHLTDPAHALQQAHELLDPDGVLVVETWDRTSRTARVFRGAWQQINPPTVLHLFSKAGLRRLLLRTAYQHPAIERTTKQVSLGLATSVIAHRLGPLEPTARRLLDRPSIARRAVRYPLDDLITATARTTSS